jgi:hypothetical protein
VTVRAVADCSFFMNTPNIVDGRPLWQSQVETIVVLQNISSAAQVSKGWGCCTEPPDCPPGALTTHGPPVFSQA